MVNKDEYIILPACYQI